MQADKRLPAADIAVYQHYLFIAAIEVPIADREKVAMFRGQPDIHHSFDTGRVGADIEHAITFCHVRQPIWKTPALVRENAKAAAKRCRADPGKVHEI
ncbi:hypothetical protein TPA0910_38860 [Streptomyces hygroscopicus subsp. sporocinereus]|uniref:Uncharacterized protein n=1 Tax=Streptomyces hygroscopicus TaxID=1912 RepID=A0ABQ3U2J2_STRHY|nr:hypothetical protein TPA0910_38860 [Streptomyces hygroscopicus]